MCDTCGCGESGNEVTIRRPGIAGGHSHEHGHTGGHSHEHGHTGGHSHEHDHEDGHSHNHEHAEVRGVLLETNILRKNNQRAERNRGYFEARRILALNLVSSPGSGKTSLLERSIRELGDAVSFAVIEGDQQTLHDAARVEAAGAPAIQVNTGNGCHLDSDMVHRAVTALQPRDGSVLMIENVGNLVCPSLFDLGEDYRVVIMSVTEGEDKPVKYPTMFRSSQLCIINKIDLLPYLDFDLEKAKAYARQVHPDMEFIEISVRSGEGMDAWYEWLRSRVK